MWYELPGLGRAPEDFSPVWNIKVIRYRKGEARQPKYIEDGEYALCPICPVDNVFVVKGFLGPKSDRTLRNNGKEPYLVCFAKVRERKDWSKGPFSVDYVVLGCPSCGYGYDVNAGKEIAERGLELIQGD